MVLGLLSKFLDNQLMMMDNQSLLNGSSRLMLRKSVEIVTLKKNKNLFGCEKTYV